MAGELLKPLGGHAVFLLLVQLAVILVVARLGAELVRRMGQPAVVGELAAGIVLGPSVLGHFAPWLFAAIFPHESAQFNLLEVVGMLGMVLLLFLTGLETDLRLLRNLGRAALIASAMGMVLPFATGFALGHFMPDEYLAQPDQRMIFSFFLATAMAISAMPVIAKILMDLDLTRRNIGLVILSAGVVDDTAGWLILSVIAGAASHGEVRFDSVLQTLLLTGAFIAAAAVLIYPISRFGLGLMVRGFKTPNADLSFMLIVTFLCAALTEHIGVHAAFGAFITGTLFRQIPSVKEETVHTLESITSAVLTPVFFASVGLKVDLWTIGGGGMLGIVLGVACFGKLIGCTLGGLWGGLRFWESVSIAVAMNARGAMGLVVATIGLSLGILNQQMFSIIVVVAIVTSFIAPVGLRLTMRKVRMTAEEARRILTEQTRGLLDPERVRVLLPTSGGPNTPQAALLASSLAKRSADPPHLLYVKAPVRWRDRIRAWLRNAPAPVGVESQLERFKRILTGNHTPTVRSIEHAQVAEAILAEAVRGFDFLVLGASHQGHSLGGPILADVIEAAPCHVVIVKAGPERPDEPYSRILVPFDGGVFARSAVELAVRCAEASGAGVTIAMVAESAATDGIGRTTMSERPSEPPSAPVEVEIADDEALSRISSIFRITDVRPSIVRLAYDGSSSPMVNEAGSGRYDLVVLGAENRAIQHRLFFGHDNEQLIRHAPVTIAVVIPSMTVLGRDNASSLQRPAGTPAMGMPVASGNSNVNAPS